MLSINFITQQISSFPTQLSHSLNTMQRKVAAVAVLAMTCLSACYLLYRWCSCLQSKKVIQQPPQPPQPVIASCDDLEDLLATAKPDAKGRILVPGHGAVFKGIIEGFVRGVKYHQFSGWDTLKECTVICSDKEIQLDKLTAWFFHLSHHEKGSSRKKVNLSCVSAKELKKILQVMSLTKEDGNFCFHMWKHMTDDPDKFKELEKYYKGSCFLNNLVRFAGRWGHLLQIKRKDFKIIEKEQILFIQDLLEVLCKDSPCTYKVLKIKHSAFELSDFFKGVTTLSEQDQVDFYQMIKDQPKMIQGFIVYCERSFHSEVLKRILESLESEDNYRLAFFENILLYSQEATFTYGENLKKFIRHLSLDQVEDLTKLIINQSSRSLELILKWLDVLDPHNRANINKILAIAIPHFDNPQDVQRIQNYQNFDVFDLEREFPFFKNKNGFVGQQDS